MARVKDRAGLAPRQEGAGETWGNVSEISKEIQAFRTATYARLSVNSFVSESDSITSQQMLMRDYIKDRNEFFLVREYIDDGISGTRFDRQAFDSLLGEVRKGNINCIIVKDFSRFGRDHIEVGNYLEKVFPFLGVRFISINDGYDSFDRECADKKLAVILKNLVNEYIAKDTSVKVISSYAAKQEKGEYDGGRAPYGYTFADERKTRFFIDERPAGVVRALFAWTIQGDSALTIVKRLTERNINPPKAYQSTGGFYRGEKERRYWNEFTVNNILQNIAYTGHMALHKWRESKADGIAPYKLGESEWKITRNTHEAIVTEGDFRLVQEILRARKERHKRLNAVDENIIRPDNLLKGKVFCGDCLAPASRMGTNYQKKAGGNQEGIRIYRYRCRTYREKGAQECTSKSISEKALEEIIYQAVMAFFWQTTCLDEVISRFHQEYFHKTQQRIKKEMDMAEDVIRQGKNEKILLYQEYRNMRRNSIKHNNIETDSKECICKDGIPDGNKEWYLREKQKKETDIHYYEKRKAQLKEKAASFEKLEKEQIGWIKEILNGRDMFSDKVEKRLTSQMASIFIDKVYLYDGKRIEIVMSFKEDVEVCL